MKKSKYSLVVLSILLFLLVFVSSASAADANATDILSVDESAGINDEKLALDSRMDNAASNDTNVLRNNGNDLLSTDNNVKSNELSDDTLKISNDELLTAGKTVWYVNSSKTSSGDGKSEANPFKTLDEALNKAEDDDTIMIASGEYKGTVNTGLSIWRNLNFIKFGDGEAIFDAEDQRRIWTVMSDSVNIFELTFKNGKSTSDGGAIYMRGGNVINCTFTDNTAPSNSGGAIYCLSYTSVTNCNFTGNTGKIGGAVYFSNEGTVSDCTFTGNNASINGGAISIINAGSVTNCNFTDNTAGTRSGGAIYFYDEGSAINCNFINNTAKMYGGAVYLTKDGNVSDCTFTGNKASSDEGGAIVMNKGDVTNCNFADNTADYMGGAITFFGDGSASNCTFTGNTATWWGGAIRFHYNGTVTNCAFVNNSAKNGNAIDSDGILESVDDNWWGSNNPNWDELINKAGIPSVYAVLNVTTNSSEISIDEYSEIATEFVWNGTTNNATNSLPKRNVKLSSNGGSLSKTEGEVGLTSQFSATAGGTYEITATVDNQQIKLTVTVKNIGIPTVLDLSMMVPVEYGPSSTVDIDGTVKNNMTGDTIKKGSVDVYLNDEFVKTVKVDKDDGSISAILGVLDAGNYTVKAVYHDDSQEFMDCEWNSSFVIMQAATEITINTTSIELIIGKGANIGAVLSPSKAGNLSYSSNDVEIADVDENGVVTAVGEGTATITVSFAGNKNYASAESKNITVTVSLRDANVTADPDSLELLIGETGQFYTTTTPEDLDIEVSSSNESVATVKLVNRVPTVTAVGEGSAVITVTINEKLYVKNSTTVAVTVNKLDTVLTVDDVKTVYNTTGVVVATLTDVNGNVVSDVKVKIVAGDLTKTALTDENGQVSLDISGLEPGEYKVSARSSGTNPIYNEAKAYAKAIVYEDKLDTTLTVSDVVTVYGVGGVVVATLTDSEGKALSDIKVKIVVGDLTKTALTDENGQVSLDISSLGPGEYKISARSSGVNDLYKEAKAYAKAVVSEEKLDTTLTVPDVYVIGGSSPVVVATLTDSNGNAIGGVKVKIVVGDLTKTALTDENGQVSLDISSLGPGEYKVSARSSGVNDLYNEAKAYAKAVVSEDKLDATLTVPDVFVVGNSSGAVVATLKDIYGNLISGVNVKLVIGDLSVTAKTDANGQVSVDVSDLAPGVYKVSARSSGVSDIYKEAKAYAKVIVSEEKLDTTLTVPDVVVDGSSSAVVVATLKDSYNYRVSGVNVKITVGDLTKTAKTDENGQVSLDISSLAPGEYKISARSSGVSDIYNESKATAKATVNAN